MLQLGHGGRGGGAASFSSTGRRRRVSWPLLPLCAVPAAACPVPVPALRGGQLLPGVCEGAQGQLWVLGKARPHSLCTAQGVWRQRPHVRQVEKLASSLRLGSRSPLLTAGILLRVSFATRALLVLDCWIVGWSSRRESC